MWSLRRSPSLIHRLPHHLIPPQRVRWPWHRLPFGTPSHLLLDPNSEVIRAAIAAGSVPCFHMPDDIVSKDLDPGQATGVVAMETRQKYLWLYSKSPPKSYPIACWARALMARQLWLLLARVEGVHCSVGRYFWEVELCSQRITFGGCICSFLHGDGRVGLSGAEWLMTPQRMR